MPGDADIESLARVESSPFTVRIRSTVHGLLGRCVFRKKHMAARARLSREEESGNSPTRGSAKSLQASIISPLVEQKVEGEQVADSPGQYITIGGGASSL